jgi:hypothetical protein
MKNNENITKQPFLPGSIVENGQPEGYPVYPESEDIYNRFKKEKRIDPEDITKSKELVIVRKDNEEDFSEDVSAIDLDIPEFESDEIEEVAGLEDEENSYFSLGGDDHIDLEENLGY